jgi:hypothetical protein
MFAALAILAAKHSYAESTTTPLAQSDFPRIVLQPEDQLVHVDGNAVFSVKADNGPLTYQWLRNGSILDGQTKASLTIENAGMKDVGFYSCNVTKELEAVPTRAASLMVFHNYTDAKTGIDPIYISAMPVGSGGSNGVCPGRYTGLATYTKTIAQGWGWTPDTNTTVHTATDTNRTNTRIEFDGKSGDHNCGQTTIAVTNPTSAAYRFTVYFTNNVPTNPYTIALDGFNP